MFNKSNFVNENITIYIAHVINKFRLIKLNWLNISDVQLP